MQARKNGGSETSACGFEDSTSTEDWIEIGPMILLKVHILKLMRWDQFRYTKRRDLL